MKKFTFLMLSIMACLVIHGQDIVTTEYATTPSSCDGAAHMDSTSIINWYWADSSGTQIQSGGVSINLLCPGFYILNYTNSSGTYQETFQIEVSPCFGLTFFASSSTTLSDINQCSGTITFELQNTNQNMVYLFNQLDSSIVFNQAYANVTGFFTMDSLCIGNYSLLVMDMGGSSCNEDFSFSIIDTCYGFQSNIQVVNPSSEGSCDGNITVITVGGTPPYTYAWNNGSDSSYIPEVCMGTYNVVVTDLNGCVINMSANVLDTLSPLAANVYTTDETTDGACDGAVNISVNTGIPPFTFYHSSGDTTQNVTGLCSGVYSVLITDASGDSTMLNYLIAGPSNIIYNYTYEDSVVVDSLFNDLIINCTIDYNNVDSAFIGSAAIYASDSVTITWAIYADSTVSYVTETYYFGGGNGVYAFSVAMFCPQRSIGQYLKIYDQVYLSDALGLDENDSQAALIYPNPFTESIQCVFTEAGDFDVQLTDMTGRVVYQNQFSQTSSVTIPGLQTLASGNYMLQIAGSNGQHVYKLMK